MDGIPCNVKWLNRMLLHGASFVCLHEAAVGEIMFHVALSVHESVYLPVATSQLKLCRQPSAWVSGDTNNVYLFYFASPGCLRRLLS